MLVDDDATLRERLARAFRERGWEVTTAGDYDEALTAAKRESPEYAVVDLRMPGRSGLEVVKDLLAVDASTKAIVLTGYGSIATTVDAIRLGAVNYLPKPADVDDILAAFARASGEPSLAAPETFEAPSLARAEWEHIHRVLADCAGNISEASRKLGIHRRSLQRKLQKYPPAR
nr:response regulator [Myxococcus fulvus]